MKQEGPPLARHVHGSSEEEPEPDSPVYSCSEDNDHPIDLRKKPGDKDKEDEDNARAASAEPDDVLSIWQRALLTGIHPYLSPLLFLGGGLRQEAEKVGHHPFFPYGLLGGNNDLLNSRTPVVCDQFGVRHAVVRTPEGSVTTVPLDGYLGPLNVVGDKDIEEPRVRVQKSELLSRLQSGPCNRTSYDERLRDESEPEDLTVSTKSIVLEGSGDDEEDLRRSRSCSDIPRYEELLDRVRVKSDSESPVSWSTPASRLSTPGKRKAEEDGGSQIINSPITRLLDPKRQEKHKMVRLERNDRSPALPTSEQETFLQKLRHAAPMPWNVYSYYTQMMQSLSTNDHEVLRSHLTSSSTVVNSGKSSPSPATTPLSTSPPSTNGESKKNARVLTGKHVRHGTGASPSTLLTLRQKIQERQKAKELAYSQSCGQQDSKQKDLSRKRATGKNAVRLVKQ